MGRYWLRHPRRLRPTPLLRWLRDLRSDIRYALRQGQRAPGLSAFAVAALAIGIGANVTMAGVIDRLLFREPTGLREGDQLARLVVVRTGGHTGEFVSHPVLLDLQRHVRAFSSVAAFSTARLRLGTEPDAPDLTAELVSATYFSTLGVSAIVGRVFTPTDGFPEGMTAGGPAVAVISHRVWRSTFGGDSSIVGRPLRIGKLTYTVAGVAPFGFRGVGTESPDVWLPLTVAADQEVRPMALADREMSWLRIVGRRRPGVSHAMLEEQVTPLIIDRDRLTRDVHDRVRVVTASIIRGRGPDAPREVAVALWLGGISTLVLLIAVANVANLLVARALVRRSEIATRLAIGAGIGRLARQLVTEGLVLAGISGTTALALAGASGGVVRRFFLRGEEGMTSFVDSRLFALSAIAALGTGVLVSLAPLAQSTTRNLEQTLRSGTAAGGGRRKHIRSLLLGVQAMLCALLLVLAGLFAQSLRRVEAIDLGMDPDRVVTAFFDFDGAMARSERDAMYIELRARVSAIPGVVRVAYADGRGLRAVNVHTADRNADESIRLTHDVPYEIPVDSGYFRALGSSLRGRDFGSDDVRGAPQVTIINEPLARLLFPNEEALGRCVYLPVGANDPDDQCWTVVGVLRGFWYARSVLKREGLLAYTPLAQRASGPLRPQQMVISVRGSPTPVISAVRAAIRQVRPDTPRVQVQAMRDVLEPELRPWQLAATMFSVFGVVALVIAAIGIYAVVAFTTTQRASEIAVRMAFGARASHVVMAVCVDSMRAAASGLGLGLAIALTLRRWIGPLLFQTSASDPWVMTGVTASLLLVAGMAVLIPTRRALRSNPATVLRRE